MIYHSNMKKNAHRISSFGASENPLANVRQRKGFRSQKKAAEYIGVSQTKIARLEATTAPMKQVNEFYKMARAYKISMDDLYQLYLKNLEHYGKK